MLSGCGRRVHAATKRRNCSTPAPKLHDIEGWPSMELVILRAGSPETPESQQPRATKPRPRSAMQAGSPRCCSACGSRAASLVCSQCVPVSYKAAEVAKAASFAEEGPPSQPPGGSSGSGSCDTRESQQPRAAKPAKPRRKMWVGLRGTDGVEVSEFASPSPSPVTPPVEPGSAEWNSALEGFKVEFCRENCRRGGVPNSSRCQRRFGEDRSSSEDYFSFGEEEEAEEEKEKEEDNATDWCIK